MIGIFLRWRQLGRRYFWPHLLLGMVAASLGLPACAQSSEPNASSESPVSSLFIGNTVRFDHLIRLQETARRPSFTVDYWHQHAIRTVIRHLSFTLTPQAQATDNDEHPLAAHKLALIDSLHALLTSHTALAAPLATTLNTPVVFLVRTSVAWHARLHGIRAGPNVLFC